MKNIICVVLLLALFISVFPAFAQSGQVTRKKPTLGGNYRYFQNEQKMSEKVFFKQLAVNPKAYNQMKTARKYTVWAAVAGGVGSGLVGAWFGSHFSPQNNTVFQSPGTLVLGAALISTTIPLSINYKKRSARAMEIYNNGIAESNSPGIKAECLLSFTGTGIQIIF